MPGLWVRRAALSARAIQSGALTAQHAGLDLAPVLADFLDGVSLFLRRHCKS